MLESRALIILARERRDLRLEMQSHALMSAFAGLLGALD